MDGRLMSLHATGDADALACGVPEPGGVAVRVRLELCQERLGRGLAALEQRLPLLGARGLRPLDRHDLLLGGGARGEDLRPELVDLGEMPEQIISCPLGTGGDLLRRVGAGQRGGEPLGLVADGGDRVVAHAPIEALRGDERHRSPPSTPLPNIPLGGISGGTGYPSRVSKHDEGDTMSATTTQFQVTGMTCGHCEMSVRDEVSEVYGI